ncbi:hypothetical protein CMV_016611 [Castanea mollissima]|uniref:Uncharacterized protein n=1 Tax=Castanea mollissima TaxID=60419 RepID=A0A8J4R7R6_9ROSI|nr:hypothetical protein CMV_016611 [Castanea mollissima]
MSDIRWYVRYSLVRIGILSGTNHGYFSTGSPAENKNNNEPIAEVSQRLLVASLSGDQKSALELIADPSVNVNFVGPVCLKSKKTKVIPCDELASQVRVEYIPEAQI